MYRRKQGFAVPVAKWFRGPLRERLRDAVLGEAMAESGFFNMDFIRRMLDQHQSGQRDNSAVLWALLMFSSFLSGHQQAGPEIAPGSGQQPEELVSNR
jgi:asparagine synthase (glutamine-hydrolysing)